jgi:peptidoglycan hydrolase-like protein with peptidoglycan-binding domain
MTLEIAASEVSLGMQGDDVARIHHALQALGRSVPVSEIASRVLGPGTAAVVRALQQELNLPATGMVDAATVRAINVLLDRVATAPRVVRGTVRDANGSPVSTGLVQLFSPSLSGESVIGKSPLREGSYQISYQPAPGSKGKLDLRVAVLDDSGLVDTTPSGTSVLSNAGPLEVVNFVLSGDAHRPRAEYDFLLDNLKPLLGTRDFAELTEDARQRDVSLLVVQTGYSTDLVTAIVLAHKFAQGTRVPPHVFYGLLREGLPANRAALEAVHPAVRRKALQAAVEQGLVPQEVDGKKIELYLTDFVPARAAVLHDLQGLLGNVLNADQLSILVGEYVANGQEPESFWAKIAANPTLSAQSGKLMLIAQVAGAVNGNDSLVSRLLQQHDIKQASDLAQLTGDQWKALIQAQGVGVPTETPGATPDEKISNYVDQILTRVEAAFPREYLAERLPPSGLRNFLKNNPYDLQSTYPEQYLKQHPDAARSLTEQDLQQLPALQRIYRLTESATETRALTEKGVHSAKQIAQLDRTVFADRHKEILSADRADVIYNRAQRILAAAMAISAQFAAGLNRTQLQALPKVDSQKQAALAASSIPNWQTLFGSFDLCACEQCASVHSPAAYLVDTLRFLGERNARDPLFARRPDLGDIELSCENTNTPVPTIDLVNEILEDAVSPPAAFVPLTLAPALEADLTELIATPALAAVFNPPLQSGARVQTLEVGARWRIWDEPFTYSVVKEGAALNVVARSRQTWGSAAELRVKPQYSKAAAQTELSQSVYPVTLPFDLPHEEAAVFLTHFGLSRWELMEALRPMPEPFDPNAPIIVRLAAERLGLTDIERRILVGEPLAPPRAPEDFWGGVPVAQLATVQDLLDRFGLRYAELEELTATWFIDPDGTVSITAKPDAPLDTCDTTRLQINGLTIEVLTRMNQLVRLWRKLGWTILETDRALHALTPDSTLPVLTNELLVRLSHVATLSSELRLHLAQALMLWKPIDTAEPHSQYRKLFYNPAVFKAQDDVFGLRPDGQELVRTDTLLVDQSATLQAVFRLNADSLAFLIAKTDGHLNLTNLSLIYRHATLARQLGLTVQELVTAIELTDLDPFSVAQSEDSLGFLEAVRAIRSSGFDLQQLDYLLRHRFNPAARFVPTDSTIARTLGEIRAGLRAVSAPSATELQELQRSAIIDRLSAALELPADVTGVLLTRLMHGGVTALQRLLDVQLVINPADPALEPALARDNAGPQFETIEKLLKIATVVQAIRLSGSHLEWLFLENAWLTVAPDPPVSPVPFASWFSLIQLQQFRQALNLGDAALEAILDAVAGVAAAVDQPAQLAAKKSLLDTLSQWLGWSALDLEALLGRADDPGDTGMLSIRLPEDYRIGLVARLNRALGLLKRLGATASEASQWCDDVVTPPHAKAIRGAAKAKYDDDAWQTLAVPLQDRLRDKQREALVSYLVARPQPWAGPTGRADAQALYSHFLIDVEMSSCQLTSRIKQAISSVQLFAQRALMGLEAGVTTSDGMWTQWARMKNFRIWEANRKVWLYPENWIEPELREDKTPFFKDLEDELLQSDLTNATAEQALKRYLEKLDEVARLEIAGVYEDDETKDFYVFARTIHVPHSYYSRRRAGDTKTWLPWQKVEVDIEGDHLIPVVWNRKLMLIWPIFTEKPFPKGVQMPEPGHTVEAADKYWEIQLAWSEFLNGRWTGKKLSDAVAFVAYEGEDSILFGPRVPALVATARMLRDDGDAHDQADPLDLPVERRDRPEGGSADLAPPPPNPSTEPRRLVARELFSFKGLVQRDSLVVRGFLRRDYRRTPADDDAQIACCFGEFRFSGCREIVTTAHRGEISGGNVPLAPTGTRFDRMWFTGSGTGLTLFDGKFQVAFTRPGPDITVRGQVNDFASIAGDSSATVVNKFDIPVLDRSDGSVRLLAPHQDLQFICDRPFIFMDAERAFIVSSTGSSGKVTLPDRAEWVHGDLTAVWRADYFPAPDPTAPDGSMPPTNVTSEMLQPLTVLVPGPRGRRVASQLAPVNLKPAFSPRTSIATFWTTRRYRFTNFSHPYLCQFVKTLDGGGVPALLSLDTQRAADPNSFSGYGPEPRVLTPHPVDEVEFQAGGAYAPYNWELFFHIPLLIANQLSRNQRFDEAQRWFHFIFDPTGPSGDEVPQRYWRTKPFYDRLAGDYEAESVQTIEKIIAEGLSPEWDAAVAVWRSNPFSPHAIAQLRTTAYQKTVVMKYIDMLIAWGDQLFRRETLESINEATQLYVLAAEILGRRPEVLERNVKPVVQTFNTLSQIGLLGNALEQIELLVSNVGDSDAPGNSSETPDPPAGQMLYFCVPENGQLLGYWDTVADRLFKIRHCMNIEGQVRQLPLFEPPIDPALLVRARAAGLSIGEVLSEAPLPNYRFSVMLQKANELVAETRNLGAELLSILEKRDAEALSTLRSGQEVRLQQAVRDVRVKQIDEANVNIAALENSREMAQSRKDYYESRDKLNALETTSLLLLGASAVPIEISAHLRVLAGVMQKFGSTKFGSPTTAGIEVGGYFIGVSVEEAAIALDAASSILNIASQATGRMADHGRRKEEWDHQADLAAIELKQIGQQLLAGEIRLAIAEQELGNHDRQIENAREVDQFLRDKFTNQDLFQWMTGQVSGLYFQSYQLAYDLARRAEACLRFELGPQASSFISFGYWDSLKKGLLAGEKLQYDLRRLELAYLEQNRREFELTKHVSLALLDPLALVELRETGRCSLRLPEEMFDLDYPGHYFRRVKSVSITLPCVVGPYATVSCTLRLLKNSIRINTVDGDNGYPRNIDSAGLPVDDARFVENTIPVKAIAASSGQNDSGVFELNFRDERYLPFEGAGVISEWSIELFNDSSEDFGRPLRQFDYDSISDAVLHVKYTAREGAGAFKSGAIAHLREYFSEDDGTPSLLMLNLRRDFPSQWSRFLEPRDPANGNVFELEVSRDLFPFRDAGKTLKINTISLLARCTDAGDYGVTVTPPAPAAPLTGANALTLSKSDTYGGLHLGQRDVAAAGIEIVPTDPPATWMITVTRPGGGNLTKDPVTNTSEFEDAILVLGYASK